MSRSVAMSLALHGNTAKNGDETVPIMNGFSSTAATADNSPNGEHVSSNGRPSPASPGSTGWCRTLRIARDVFLVFATSVVAITTCTAFTPIMPLVAEEKTSNASQRGAAVGFIFGLSLFSGFLFSPFIAKDMSRTYPRLVHLLGVTTVSGCCFLFGFVDRIRSWPQFLAVCYALSFVQGIGWVAVFIAMVAVLAQVLPERPGMVAALVELAAGLGFGLGPALGSVLWHAAGSRLILTGVVFGGLSLAAAVVCGVAAFFASPVLDPTPVLTAPTTGSDSKKSMPIGTLFVLRQPMNIVALALGVMLQGFLAYLFPVLSLYMKHQFAVHPSQLGLGLFANNLAYTFGALGGGILADWYGPRRFIVLGLLIAALGSLMQGPASMFAIKPTLVGLYLGLSIGGFGAGLAFTPLLPLMVDTLLLTGYGHSTHLTTVVGGLLRMAVCLGFSIAPPIGGALTPVFGFPNSTSFLALLLVIALLVFLAACMCERNGPLSATLRSLPFLPSRCKTSQNNGNDEDPSDAIRLKEIPHTRDRE